ncbi:MAG: matrixin family metalloprotease [Bdellovibrionaceae bacterium]|nr:matrixin family metalloprotease [Pseudobdellovibrionaceae bacterium]
MVVGIIIGIHIVNNAKGGHYIMLFPRLTIFSLLFVSSIFSACSDKKTPSPVSKKIFVQGDPYNIVKGSTFNTQIDFPQQVFENNEYALTTGLNFLEKQEETSSTENIRTENGSKEIEQNSLDNQIFKLKKGVGKYFLSIEFEGSFLKMYRDKNGKSYVEAESKEGTSNSTMDLLHISHSEDFRNLSFLMYGKDKNGIRTLVALYFGPPTNILDLAKKDNSGYYYMLGQSRPYRWKQDRILKINFCHPQAEENKDYIKIQNGVLQWQEGLENRLEIELTATKVYPPFSDFNSHCIYIVPDYFSHPSFVSSNDGSTITIPDFSKDTFLDSDIFIFDKEEQKVWILLEKKLSKLGFDITLEERKEIEKEVRLTLDKLRSFVFIHELGHLLGLDHPFTESEDKNIFSVMNYGSSKEITDYDIRAIQNLYPVIPKLDSKNPESLAIIE